MRAACQARACGAAGHVTESWCLRALLLLPALCSEEDGRSGPGEFLQNRGRRSGAVSFLPDAEPGNRTAARLRTGHSSGLNTHTHTGARRRARAHTLIYTHTRAARSGLSTPPGGRVCGLGVLSEGTADGIGTRYSGQLCGTHGEPENRRTGEGLFSSARETVARFLRWPVISEIVYRARFV